MVFTLGRCDCCSEMGHLEQRVCPSCVAAYGERMARLMGRARGDAAFAEACAARMSAEARAAFHRFLHAPGVTPQGSLRKTTARSSSEQTSGRAHLRSIGERKRS